MIKCKRITILNDFLKIKKKLFRIVILKQKRLIGVYLSVSILHLITEA